MSVGAAGGVKKAALACALLLSLSAACAVPEPAQSTGEELAFRNARYRITREVRADRDGAQSLLRVRMLPQAGWHFADDAPAGLRLGALAGYRFAAASQKGEDAVERSEQGITFESGFRAAAAGKGGVLPARVKFGLCRDGDTRCEIIERDVELKLPPQP